MFSDKNMDTLKTQDLMLRSTARGSGSSNSCCSESTGTQKLNELQAEGAKLLLEIVKRSCLIMQVKPESPNWCHVIDVKSH